MTAAAWIRVAVGVGLAVLTWIAIVARLVGG